jgi:hypothetical protein
MDCAQEWFRRGDGNSACTQCRAKIEEVRRVF